MVKWRNAPVSGIAALLLAMLAAMSGCEVYDEPAPVAAKGNREAPAADSAQAAAPVIVADAPPMNAAAPTASEYAAAFGSTDAPALVPIERRPASVAPVQAPPQAPTQAMPTPDRLIFVSNFAEAMAMAQRERRPLMLFFTAEWCHYCKEMAAEAFRNPQVVSIGQRFVCVVVDADAAPQLCQQLRIRAFPTVQFLSPSGVPLNRAVGRKSGAELALEMRAALRATAERQKSPSTLRR